MQYENFSRHLREKYSTCVHVTDQLVDQLKYNNHLRKSSTTFVHDLNNKNIIKAQQEISFPLISYLNEFEYDKEKSTIENKNEFEPYFNECLLAAERIKNNRRSDRDRKICYENFILKQKLERIKKQSGQNARINLEKDYRNHCRLLISKANCERDAIKSINKRFITKQTLLSNEKDFNEERSSETVITSSHSLSPINSESKTTLSENEDDQATAADVDASIEYCDSRSPVLRKQRNNRNFNCVQSISTKCKEIYYLKKENRRFFHTENNPVYQHLSNIDMMMVRDTTMPLSTCQTSKHFSICILPHFDSDVIKPMNKSYDRPYAFKKEILYH